MNSLEGKYRFKTNAGVYVTATVRRTSAYLVSLEYEDGSPPYHYVETAENLTDEILDNDWYKKFSVFEHHESEVLPVREPASADVGAERTPESRPSLDGSVQRQPLPEDWVQQVSAPTHFQGRALPFVAEVEEWVRVERVQRPTTPDYDQKWTVWHEVREIFRLGDRSRTILPQYAGIINIWFWCGNGLNVEGPNLHRPRVLEFGIRPEGFTKGQTCLACWVRRANAGRKRGWGGLSEVEAD